MGAPTITRIGEHTVRAQWTLTQADPTGAPLGKLFADYVDRSVDIRGTFDSATVVWEGSNDGSNFTTLTDPQGGAISKTGAAIEQVSEQTLLQRPNSSGGQASQSVVVTLIARRQRGGKEV